MQRSLLTFTLAFLVLVPLAPAQEELGTFGASADLARSWRRREITPDIDGDQFIGTGRLANHFLVVIQSRAVLEEEADFERELSLFTVNLRAAGEDVEEGESSFERVRDFGHASQSFGLFVGGMDLTYDVHLVGRDCLGYVLMAWAPASRADSLTKAMADVVEGFALPGPESEWSRSTIPTTFKTPLGAGAQAVFALPPSMFGPAPNAGDALFALATPETEVGVYVLASSAWSLDSAKADVFEALGGEAGGLQRLKSEPFALGEREGERTLYHWVDDNVSVESYVVPVAPELYLDLRFTWDGGPERYTRLRDQLARSLRIDERPVVDAFPRTEALPASAARPDAAQSALLAAAASVAQVPASPQQILRGDGGLYFVRSSEVHLLGPDAERSTRVFSGDWGYATMGSFVDGELLIDGPDGAIQRVRDGVAQPTGAEGAVFAALPGGALLLAPPAPPLPAGFGIGAYDSAGAGLILQPAAGREQRFEVEGEIGRLVASNDGERALVGARSTGIGYGPMELRVLALADGRETPIGRWDLSCVAPAHDGWLVTGRPEDGPSGVYALTEDGAAELLVGGDNMLGVELRDDTLLLATTLETTFGPDRLARLVSLTLDDARRLGPACRSLGTSAFVALAQAAFEAAKIDARDPSALSRSADVRRVADALRAAASERGAALPADALGLDALAYDLASRPELPHEGFLALTALVSAHLLDGGARWVEGGAAPGDLGFQGRSLEDHAHAVAFLPAEILVQTSLEETSWWQPIAEMLDYADGRELLLGMDAATLGAALLEAEVDLSGVAQLRVGELIELLASAPRNTHLRGRVYRELVRADRPSAAQGVAQVYARTDEPAAVDVLAWLGARVLAGEAPIDELRDAIARFPEELELYLLLGRAYESVGPAKAEHARACFEHALENGWGAVEGAASEGLERLGQ